MVAAASAPRKSTSLRPAAQRRRVALTWLGPLALAIVMIAAAVLRLRDLGARSLWVDELFGVGLAAQDLPTIVTVLYGEEANMTLYYLVMYGWLGLVGPTANEFWIRLPSVAFGLASIWALYRLGAELDGRLAGLLAALLAAVNAYHVEMSQEARAYTLWALCATLSWLFLLRALGGPGRRAWVAYAAATALAFYAHFFTAFVVLAQCAMVGLRLRRPELRALALSGCGVGLLCLPFLPFFVLNNDGSQILHVRQSGPDELLDLVRQFAGGTSTLLGVYAALGGLGIVLGVARLAGTGTRDQLARRATPLLWLLIPILTVFALSYVKPMFKERYLFAAMPAFPLLAAVGLAALRPAPLRAAAVLGVVWLSLGTAFGDFRVRQDENWRGATEYLSANARPDDGWIFVSKRGQLGYEYYDGRLGAARVDRPPLDVIEPFDWHDLARSEGYYRALASGTERLPEFAQRHPRIWLVLSHEFDSTFDGDTSESVRNWLTRRGYGARQRTFQGIRVLLYERRA